MTAPSSFADDSGDTNSATDRKQEKVNGKFYIKLIWIFFKQTLVFVVKLQTSISNILIK